MWRLALVVGVCLTACQFDEGGIPAVGDGAAVSADSSVSPDAALAIDAPLPLDAPVAPCVDSDGDTFLVINLAGANCPGPLDCDDSDPNAYPGQESYYDQQRTSGGYDYNCDGDETLFDGRNGGNCRSEWWECLGTGWVNGVPMCGNVGTWHSCESVNGSCLETARLETKMLCR